MGIDFKSYKTWEIIGTIVAIIVIALFIFPPSCSDSYSESDNTGSISSRGLDLEGYKIVLVPYYSDEYSSEYFVRGNVLIKDNGSNTEVCGPLEKIDNNVYEVGVGSDYQHGGKIWPYNAAIFKRENDKIGRVTDATYRFAVFDFNEMKVYENSSSYGYRNINDEEYLKFKLVKK